MRLRVGAGTDTGRVRTLNEDVYVLREDRGLFLVCDGMGGAPAGEVASQLAAEAILERLDAADEVEEPLRQRQPLPALDASSGGRGAAVE